MLYLIRHADAIDLPDDAARPLSKRGRRQVEAMGQFLRRTDRLGVAAIWHSPLLRARETAELLAKEMRLDVPLTEHRTLIPEADPEVLVKKLAAAPDAVALVGHNPHLELLATRLLAGAGRPTVVLMKKCAVLALERDELSWIVRWHVSPELLGE